MDEVKTEGGVLKSIIQCGEHKDEEIKFYCVDHDLQVCSACVAVNHRKCEDVKTLENAAGGSRNNSNIPELCETFEEMIRISQWMIEDRNKNLIDIETIYSKRQDAISKFREQINKHLDSLEAKLKKEFADMHKECKEKIEDDLEELETNKQIMENCREVANVCSENASETQVFLGTKTLQKRRKQQETLLKTKLNGSLKRFSYNLELEQKLGTLQKRIKSMGHVFKEVEEIDTKQTVKNLKFINFRNFRDCKANEIKTIDVPGANLITSGLFLPDGIILLCNYTDASLLLYDHDGHQKKDISLLERPRDIALIDNKEAVVTLPEVQMLKFIDLITFQGGQTIHVGGLHNGVGYDGKHLVVGCRDYYYSIAVIEKNGNIIRKIKTEFLSRGEGCIAVYDNKIYYPADIFLHCYDISGRDMFHYCEGHMNSAYGVTRDDEGNIYVSVKFSDNVHQLTPDGKLNKIILSQNDGVRYPRGIDFDRNSGKLLVTFDSQVKLYQLEK